MSQQIQFTTSSQVSKLSYIYHQSQVNQLASYVATNTVHSIAPKLHLYISSIIQVNKLSNHVANMYQLKYISICIIATLHHRWAGTGFNFTLKSFELKLASHIAPQRSMTCPNLSYSVGSRRLRPERGRTWKRCVELIWFAWPRNANLTWFWKKYNTFIAFNSFHKQPD